MMSKRKRPKKTRVYKKRYKLKAKKPGKIGGRKKFSTREYGSPRYAEWRRLVRNRDEHKCQWPDCKAKNKLQVHHIKKWASCPGLRFEPKNGITLCKKHHDRIRHKEQIYERTFFRIVYDKYRLRDIQIPETLEELEKESENNVEPDDNNETSIE